MTSRYWIEVIQELNGVAPFVSDSLNANTINNTHPWSHTAENLSTWLYRQINVDINTLLLSYIGNIQSILSTWVYVITWEDRDLMTERHTTIAALWKASESARKTDSGKLSCDSRDNRDVYISGFEAIKWRRQIF